jgi:hypothetical protein
MLARASVAIPLAAPISTMIGTSDGMRATLASIPSPTACTTKIAAVIGR